MDTPFQRAAKTRWPGYTVEGTGQYGVVCSVMRTVQLYEYAMWAKTYAQEVHHPQCEHKLCLVKPDYQAAQILTSPALAERDR